MELSKDLTTIKELIIEQIKTNERQELYNESECGCGLDDLTPCDYCGKDTGYETSNISITIIDSEGIIFEYWNKGYYCPECAEKLIDGILSSIPVPERYDDDFRDDNKCIEIEKEIIREQIDSWK